MHIPDRTQNKDESYFSKKNKIFDRIGITCSEQNPSNTELFLKLESFPPVLLAKCIKFQKKNQQNPVSPFVLL